MRDNRSDEDEQEIEIGRGLNAGIGTGKATASQPAAAARKPGATKRALDEAATHAPSRGAVERGPACGGHQESKRPKLNEGVPAARLGRIALALPPALPPAAPLAVARADPATALTLRVDVDFDQAFALPLGSRTRAKPTLPISDLTDLSVADTLRRVAMEASEKRRAAQAAAAAAEAGRARPAALTADRPTAERRTGHESRYAERAREWCARLKELVAGDFELSTERTKPCVARAVPAPDDPACGVPEQVLARAAPMSRAFGSLYEESTQSQMRFRLLTILYRLVTVTAAAPLRAARRTLCCPRCSQRAAFRAVRYVRSVTRAASCALRPARQPSQPLTALRLRSAATPVPPP
jgi:hypothetical protein